MTNEPVLQINHLQKKFGHFEALKNITFNGECQIFCVNGSPLPLASF